MFPSRMPSVSMVGGGVDRRIVVRRVGLRHSAAAYHSRLPGCSPLFGNGGVLRWEGSGRGGE